jgi:hypothetical protein
VTGLERSGKTTIAAFLDAHPDIAVPPVGTNMWHYFAFRYGNLEDLGNLAACLDDMMAYDRVTWLEPDREAIEEVFHVGEPSYGRLFHIIMSQYGERVGKPVWGTQSAWLDWYIDDVFATDPGTTVIHVLRDPRDRYAEVKGLWGEGRGQAGAASAKWNTAVRLARRNLARHEGRYRVVRFEDLVRNPEGTLAGICQLVGVAFDDRMLSAVKRNMGEIERGVRKAPLVDMLSADRLRTSERVLGSREVDFIQASTQRGRRRHGYEDIESGDALSGKLANMAGYWPGQIARYLAWTVLDRRARLWPRRFGEKIDPDYVIESVDA